MADFGSPIAQNVNVNPNQAVQTLSELVGLKQQQQALQTGQYQQQSAQAAAQQDQQKNKELTDLGNFVRLASQDPSFHREDGSLDVEKFQRGAAAVAPVYGQSYIGQATTNANAMIENRSALLKLTNEQRSTIGQLFGAVASKPDATPADFQEAIENARDISDDPKWKQAVDRMIFAHPNTTGMTDSQASQSTRKLAASIATQAGSAASSPSQVDTGTTVQPGTTNKYTGEFTPAGAAVKKDIEGQAAAAARGSARASGVANSDIDRANQVSASIKSAPAGIQTTQQIDDLADQIHSGKFAGWVSKQAAAAGLSESTYARQLLEKDIGIIRTQMTSSAQSDSRAATILSGTPDATSDAQTIHGAMDYVRGSFRQNLSQGRNLSAYKAKHPDLSGFQGADDAFTGGAGPLVHEFLSLKGKDEQAAFYRRNFGNAQEALKFRNQARAAAHTLGLDNADR